MSDEKLISLYLTTQEVAYFTKLYHRYSVKVYSKCMSLLKDEFLAQDATQDIFLKVLINLSKFSQRSRFSTWLYSITYNYCIDLLRKKKKGLVLNEPENDTGYVEDVEDKFLLETKVNRLKIILDKIPVTDKAILLMKYMDEMSIKEISAAIDKSESAVKMKIKRAKHRFRRKYEELYND